MNRKCVSVFFVLWAAVAVISPVQASDAKGQWYLLAGIGNSDSDFATTAIDFIDGDDTSYEIGAGYALTDNISIEASYQDLGTTTGHVRCPPDLVCITLFSLESVEIDGFSAAVRGSLPVTDSLSLFARLGLLNWDASARSAVVNDSGTDLLYGVGIAGNLNDSLALQLSYEKADVGIDTVKLGLHLRF